MSGCLVLFRRLAIALMMCGVLTGLAASRAEARIFVGIGVPFYGPGFYPLPYYYPPPAYYPPPPLYYAPPPPVYYPQQSYAQPAMPSVGQSCHAGAYVCPMDRPAASGSACYCLDNRGQRVAGRAT